MSTEKQFRSPPTVNFDLLYGVMRYTILSPAFAAGLLLFTHFFQKRAPADDKSKLYLAAYFAATWTFWFGTWSSKVWGSKSWRHGWQGLTGLHRIDWNEQIVLVTGGAQGVGKAIVDILDIKKVTVVVLDMSSQPDNSEQYNDVHFYKCDVSDYESVTRVAETIREEVGTPTVIINNAGTVAGRSILELSEADIRKTISVNVLGPFWTIKAFLPGLVEGGHGHIINVSSFLGTIGVANLSEYCASKSALLGLHDSLQAEIKQLPNQPLILTSTVFPGHIRTPLFAGLGHFSTANAFFFPLLEPYQVATAIVDKIEKEEGGELHLPVLGNMSWLWRGLPSWARDAVKWFSQADELMGDFHGEKKAAQQSKQPKKDL